MPLFDYRCFDCGAVEEELVQSPFPEDFPCDCGGRKVRMMGKPAFKLSWALPPMSEAKDIWEGFPGLEDSDGINQSQYKRKKEFFYNKE